MTEPQRPFETKLREAGERLEDELRKAVQYIDDEVVPEVRRSGSAALRAAAERLRHLANRMDDESRRRENGGS